MDNIWSKSILTIDNLNTIRDLRFNKRNLYSYKNILPIKKGNKILDVGCGTGSLTRSLYECYDDVKIVGIDYDSEYIKYCKSLLIKNNSKIEYAYGDACALDFSESEFDITISSSVIEHVDNTKFLMEQYRVLKNFGYIIIINVAGYKESLGKFAEICPITEDENKIRNELGEYAFNNIRKPLNRFLLHKKPYHKWLELMDSVGFKNISYNISKTFNAVDNETDRDISKLIIENFYANDKDLISVIKNNCSDIGIINKTNELENLINNRRDKRIEIYNSSIKMWDYIETDNNIFIGQKIINK
jgi:ubiquinone/menaquinone biosynthesis C-methylase UbiE